MAEIHSLTRRIDAEGARRLIEALQHDIDSGRDLGPRGPQMRALGSSLEFVSNELRRELESLSVGSPSNDPSLNAARADLLRCMGDLKHLADTIARLGILAQSYTA